MHLAFGGRLLAAGAVAVAVIATAAAGLAAAGPGQPDQGAPHAQDASVIVRPGVLHLKREARQGPATTAQCEQSLRVACYNPAQIQQAYGLAALYAKGITGRGRTIVIVDPYGSPTIRGDLHAFDSSEGLSDPPALKVIQPAGRVPRYNPNSSGMVGWATETTLDVEWAHAVAPGANILLSETPGGGNSGGVDMTQIITAEKYVVKHHLGDVISQSFAATEQAIGSAADVASLRGAYTAANAARITVLAGAGDSGAAGLRQDQRDFYPYPVTAWPASDPLVTAVGGTRLNLDENGNRTSADTAWNDTYSQTANELVNGNSGPNPLAGGGGKSVIFPRPAYQAAVARVTGNHRGVPDISMSGACTGTVNVYQSFGGQQAGWYALCGTSESTPLFAGVVALAAQAAGHPLGLINPALYRLAAQHAPGIVSVRSGDNTVTFRQGGRRYTVRGFTARAGYSLVAGLGTVNAAFLVPELARLAGR
jgi:subtilase family serine protease